MFISRHAYDELRADYIKANAVRESLTLQNANLNAHMDWMRIRLTEMSMERAALLKRYLNIDVPTASFEAPNPYPDPNEAIDFSDVGDAMAEKLGISWASDGTLQYANK